MRRTDTPPDASHRGFPAAEALNNGSLKRNTFELGDFEFNLTGSILKIPFIMSGTIALLFSGTFVLLGIDQFICFFDEQGIKVFLYIGTDKIFQIVIY